MSVPSSPNAGVKYNKKKLDYAISPYGVSGSSEVG